MSTPKYFRNFPNIQYAVSANKAGIPTYINIKDYFNELMSINMKVWEIEDNIRKLEKIQKFDSEFIKLARDVYKTNDKRFDLKNQINDLFNSTIKEQKSYEEY